MIKNEISIDGRLCILYQDEAATHLLIQPIDEHGLELLDQEIEAIKKLSDKPFSLVAFMIKDWNQELTPWAAPAVFGKVPFGSGAEKTLEFITSRLLPEVQENIPHLILGGYSLAGLFALWSGYQTDKFDGVVAASPSVWFPQWIEYATDNKPLADSRSAIVLELTVSLEEDAISDLCCQLPIPADYDGVGSRGTKFVFYL